LFIPKFNPAPGELKFFHFIFFLPLLAGCFSVRSNSDFSYQKLPAPAYRQLLLDTPGYHLIDVRTAREFRKSHISGAMNFSLLAFHFRRDVDTLSRNIPVFIYCQTCHRSPLAARKLKRKGFTRVYDLEEGFSKWQR
jgi:rhodanese-related sulfurtransferase